MEHTELAKRTARVAVLAIALVLLAACGWPDREGTEDVGEPTTGDSTAIAEDAGAGTVTGLSLAGSWELVELAVDGGPVDVPDRPILITIADGRIEGDGGCNRFSGPLTSADDSLTIGPLTRAEQACEDLEFESTYVDALLAASAWEAAPDGIAFTSAGIRIAYRLAAAEPVEATPLVGTVWLLDAVYGPGEGPERAVSAVDQDAPAIELVIGSNTATVISEPCTDAVYEVMFTRAESGGSFEVIGGGGVECRGSEGDNPNHDVATGGLVNASGYLIGGGRLVLIGEEGELIGFTAQDSGEG